MTTNTTVFPCDQHICCATNTHPHTHYTHTQLIPCGPGNQTLPVLGSYQQKPRVLPPSIKDAKDDLQWSSNCGTYLWYDSLQFFPNTDSFTCLQKYPAFTRNKEQLRVGVILARLPLKRLCICIPQSANFAP
jgi:hypothetical protein